MLIRRRSLALVAALGLLASVGLVAHRLSDRSRWLEVAPVGGLTSRGSFLASFQRDFATSRVLPDGQLRLEPADAAIVRIEPGDGSHRDLVDRLAYEIRLAPDGRDLAFIADGGSLWIKPIEGGEAVPVPGFEGQGLCWTPDGSAIVSTASQGSRPSHAGRIGIGGTWRFAVPGLARIRLELSDTEVVQDWSRDGRWLVTMSSRNLVPGRMADFAIYRMAPDGSDELPLATGGMNIGARFSPDGRRVAYTHFDHPSNVGAVWIVEVDGTNARKLVEAGDHNVRACWSPDGRSLVVKGFRDAFVIDADGSNRRPLGLRWERRRPLWSLPPGLGGIRGDPRWIGSIEWVDLPPR